MTEYSEVVTIVVKAALRAQAEAAAVAADPTGGAGTFIPGVPLRIIGDATNTVVAYWCRWNMKPAQRGAFAAALTGPVNILAPGVAVPGNRDQWLFDSNGTSGWTGSQVLTTLGYATLAPPY